MTGLGARDSGLVRVLVPVLVLLSVAAPVTSVQQRQQPNDPRVGYVYPAGGQQGTTFTTTVGGRFLDGVDDVIVSGDGVTAKVLSLDKPLPQPRIVELREKLRQLAEQADPDKRKEAVALRQRIAEDTIRRANPALSELVTLEVSVGRGARPGARFLRLVTPRGVSNPLVFEVGELQEVSEVPAATGPTDIAIPATVNGRLVPGEEDPLRFGGRQGMQYRPGDVDRFRFRARKGQRLVVSVAARALMPYLSDAVPGWIQAAVAVRDIDGREVAFADDHLHHADPVLQFTAPSDGDYVVEIEDVLYRGREDFVYRLRIAEATAPPTVVAPGDRTQRLRLPATVTGRIDAPGDRDDFTFTAKRGERIVLDVSARRLGSPVDSVLELFDTAGRRVAVNDDAPAAAWGLNTHDADSFIATGLPADGTYTARVSDAQRQGGPAYVYRLRIGPPAPDFELRVTPSAVSGAPGASVPVNVEVHRIDGFDGEVALSLKDAPQGCALSGVIPAGAQKAAATLTIPRGRRQTFRIAVVGTARIGGKSVSREAVPADDMMQAFFYHHLVAADGLYVTVRGRR